MIGVGVIGVGYWGPNLIRNFVTHPQTHMKACCDLKSDRLQYIRRLYPAIETHRDFQNIINDSGIDLVVICTPVHSHFELAQAALENGKHVLIEKPMTATVGECEQLMELAQRKQLKIFIDHTFLFHGAVSKIKSLINADELGDLYYFDSVRVNLGLFQHDVNVLWDLAPHDISIMQYLIDRKPESVVATGAAHLDNGLEDVAYLTVYYPGNLLAHIQVNWLSPVKIRQTLLAGSRKMIVWDDNQPSEKLRVYDKGIEVIETDAQVYKTLVQYRTGDMHCPKIDATEALAVEVQNIVDVLIKGAKPVSDGLSGLMVVKILEAAQHSIKQHGREIKI